MNRLSQTILPLVLSIGLVGGLEISAIASPRYYRDNRSGVVIISPSRRGYNNYHHRNYRPRRSRRYNSYDCDRRYRRVGRRNRRYYSGQRVILHSPIYRDSPSNGRGNNRNYIRVIRY